jgi:transcriptional regulator with XRE-family HTH domain
MDIRNNIKTIRERLGLSQYELAFRMELDQSSYSRLEKRGNKLSIEQIKSICDAMKVDIYEVLNGTIESNAKSGKTDEELDTKIKDLESLVLSQKKILEDKETILKYTNEKIQEIDNFLIETFELLLLKVLFENKIGKIITYNKEGQEKKISEISDWDSQIKLNEYYFLSNISSEDSLNLIFITENELDEILKIEQDLLFSENRLLIQLANMEFVREKFNHLSKDSFELINFKAILIKGILLKKRLRFKE